MKRLALLVLATGCAADPDPAFHVRGALHDPSAASQVVATAGSDRVIAAIDRRGGFELALVPGRAWAIAFADDRAALVATWRANGLDALAPAAPGSLELGDVAIRDGYATGTAEWGAVVDAMGVDEATAAAIGAHDDLALRTATPDSDGDGQIDASAPRLDLLADVRPTAGGRPLRLDDLVHGTAVDGYELLGTGVVAAVAADSVTFEAPFWGTYAGISTPVVPAGTPIGAPALRTGSLDGVATIGVVARPLHDVPRGRYVFGGYTFDRVLPPSDAQLRTGSLAPTLHLVPTDPQCATDCAIASVDLAWPDGAGRAARVDLVTPLGYIGLDFPAGRAASLPWARKPERISGMTTADLSRVTTGTICYVAITYEDPFGVRMTSSIANPACP